MMFFPLFWWWNVRRSAHVQVCRGLDFYLNAYFVIYVSLGDSWIERVQQSVYEPVTLTQSLSSFGSVWTHVPVNTREHNNPDAVWRSASEQWETTQHSERKALYIAGDPTHPTHSFFSLLPSGRRLRSLQARTNRLKDSFIHQAVRKLNSLLSLPPLPSLTPRTTELWPPPAPHTTHTHTHTLWQAPVTLYSIGLSSFNYLFWQSE